MSADEESFVREQYATPANLRARKAAYVNAEGDDPRELVAVAAAKPRRVLYHVPISTAGSRSSRG